MQESRAVDQQQPDAGQDRTGDKDGPIAHHSPMLPAMKPPSIIHRGCVGIQRSGCSGESGTSFWQ